MRHFEFWHPRFFEAPYYVFLMLRCAQKALPIKFLAKANYALDHGELGLGSKYSTQMAFGQNRFLPTMLLDASQSSGVLEDAIGAFAHEHGYPLILKPDIGAVGKGIIRLDKAKDTTQAVGALQGSYLLQSFTPFECEYGVFFVRHKGVNQITGINKKHFPTVVGNGKDSIAELANAHKRRTDHWRIFLKYIDTERVPVDGEQVQLSFIGSRSPMPVIRNRAGARYSRWNPAWCSVRRDSWKTGTC